MKRRCRSLVYLYKPAGYLILSRHCKRSDEIIISITHAACFRSPYKLVVNKIKYIN